MKSEKKKSPPNLALQTYLVHKSHVSMALNVGIN